MSNIAFTTSISAIIRGDIRIGIWIKSEFETEKVKHFLADISIENKDSLIFYENACIGLNTDLIDDTISSDGISYRNKVFDILTSDKVKKYVDNNGYFNNIVYVDGKVLKEKYQSIEEILPNIRNDYPFNVYKKSVKNDEDRYETLRLQFEDSGDISVEESIKK